MDRRTAIRTALIISAGAALLPSCRQKEKNAVSYRNFSVTGEQQEMLSGLTGFIIPTTDFVGAADVKADEFTLMMVDDCYSPDKQKQFVNGLQQFDKATTKKYGSTFADCTIPQKKEWLATLESKKDAPADVLTFYQIVKQHTLQAFTSSKPYLLQVRKYNMVPGPNFKGCIPVKNKTA